MRVVEKDLLLRAEQGSSGNAVEAQCGSNINVGRRPYGQSGVRVVKVKRTSTGQRQKALDPAWVLGS